MNTRGVFKLGFRHGARSGEQLKVASRLTVLAPLDYTYFVTVVLSKHPRGVVLETLDTRASTPGANGFPILLWDLILPCHRVQNTLFSLETRRSHGRVIEIGWSVPFSCMGVDALDVD